MLFPFSRRARARCLRRRLAAVIAAKRAEIAALKAEAHDYKRRFHEADEKFSLRGTDEYNDKKFPVHDAVLAERRRRFDSDNNWYKQELKRYDSHLIQLVQRDSALAVDADLPSGMPEKPRNNKMKRMCPCCCSSPAVTPPSDSDPQVYAQDESLHKAENKVHECERRLVDTEEELDRVDQNLLKARQDEDSDQIDEVNTTKERMERRLKERLQDIKLVRTELKFVQNQVFDSWRQNSEEEFKKILDAFPEPHR